MAPMVTLTKSEWRDGCSWPGQESSATPVLRQQTCLACLVSLAARQSGSQVSDETEQSGGIADLDSLTSSPASLSLARAAQPHVAWPGCLVNCEA